MLSYISVYKNESLVVTGHENGAIIMHEVWETTVVSDEWNSMCIERVGMFQIPEGMSRIDIL